MKYQLKPEYEGLRITRNNIKLGQITFTPDVKPEHYKNYVALGFEELFIEVAEEIVADAIHLIVEKVEDVIENIQDKRKAKRN